MFQSENVGRDPVDKKVSVRRDMGPADSKLAPMGMRGCVSAGQCGDVSRRGQRDEAGMGENQILKFFHAALMM